MQQLEVPFVRLKPARYADGLRAATRRSRAGTPDRSASVRCADRSTSCERFVGLAPRLRKPLGEFYGGLAASEARHQRCICGSRSSAPVAAIGAPGSRSSRKSKRTCDVAGPAAALPLGPSRLTTTSPVRTPAHSTAARCLARTNRRARCARALCAVDLRARAPPADAYGRE